MVAVLKNRIYDLTVNDRCISINKALLVDIFYALVKKIRRYFDI